jgi:hypothetical protein
MPPEKSFAETEKKAREGGSCPKRPDKELLKRLRTLRLDSLDSAPQATFPASSVPLSSLQGRAAGLPPQAHDKGAGQALLVCPCMKHSNQGPAVAPAHSKFLQTWPGKTQVQGRLATGKLASRATPAKRQPNARTYRMVTWRWSSQVTPLKEHASAAFTQVDWSAFFLASLFLNSIRAATSWVGVDPAAATGSKGTSSTSAAATRGSQARPAILPRCQSLRCKILLNDWEILRSTGRVQVGWRWMGFKPGARTVELGNLSNATSQPMCAICT